MPGRLVGVSRRRRRRTGLPAGAADPRAAHPPREGDLQHLHRAGAARRHGQHVRRLARPGGPAPRSPGGARATPPPCADALRAGGVEVVDDAFFDTVTVRVPGRAAEVVAAAGATGASTCWRVDADPVSAQRRRDDQRRATVARGAGARSASPAPTPCAVASADAARGRPSAGAHVATTSPTRSSTSHHSETAMLRYLRRLADRDFALDRGMIPLGSCTMKLNATTEMEAVTWPEFADAAPVRPGRADRGHPRADRRPVGVAVRDHRLRRGVAAAQRRVAGRARRACWRSTPTTRRAATTQRNVCLIPASAHGTNAASAVMAGLQGRRRQDRRRTATSTWTTCGPRSSSTATTSPRSW